MEIYTYLLTYLLTYSTVQSISWEANRFAASQEIPRISRNLKVHYRTHKRPPPVSILIEIDPVHNTTTQFLKIHLNNILLFKPETPKRSLSLKFLHQNPVYSSPLPHMGYIPSPHRGELKPKYCDIIAFYRCSKLWFINPLTPNVNCIGRTAPLTSKVAFYIFIQQI